MTYSYDYHNAKTVQQQQSGAIASIIVKNHLYNTGNDTTHLYSRCLCCLTTLHTLHNEYRWRWNVPINILRIVKHPRRVARHVAPCPAHHDLMTLFMYWLRVHCCGLNIVNTDHALTHVDCTIQLSPLQNQCIHTSIAYRHLSSILYLHKYNFSYTLLASICETGSLTPFHASRNVAVR